MPLIGQSNMVNNWRYYHFNSVGAFAITDAKLYVPVATLSAQDNAKLLQKLRSGFKRTINWNKYLFISS